jgi:hypothetical protein
LLNTFELVLRVEDLLLQSCEVSLHALDCCTVYSLLLEGLLVVLRTRVGFNKIVVRQDPT